MPRTLHNQLTAQAVKHAKPGRHADGGGLYLLVKQTGARSWVYRFMLNGRSRDVGLGSAGPGGLSLAQARDARDALRVKVRAGIDPLEERAQEAAQAAQEAEAARAAAITFKDVATAYIAANEDSWRNSKHRQQWRNTLATYVYSEIGDLPVAAIRTEHVKRILDPIWKTKSETASRIRGRIEAVLDSAKAQGFREGENPARWKGHLQQVLPARTKLSRGHHKAMPYDDVDSFIRRLREREAVSALALEFTILTGARSGEVLGATWDEIDLGAAMWTVPAERMKAAKEHRVPLSPRAVEILEQVKRLGGHYVFPGARGGKLSSMAMTMLLRRMKVDVTVHGFRSTFRDWAAEQTGYAHEVAEMALAHTIGNATERAYRRGDLFVKRRRLMEDWARFCESAGATSATVTPIRQVPGA